MNDLKKRSSKQKHVKKKMQWLHISKISFIYFEDIMLDDDTICLSLFRPKLILHT